LTKAKVEKINRSDTQNTKRFVFFSFVLGLLCLPPERGGCCSSTIMHHMGVLCCVCVFFSDFGGGVVLFLGDAPPS
jgi:hypothetical protein